MNIFVLDSDLHRCAAFHNDSHVTKMITEHRQMMCSVYRDHPETPVGFNAFRKIHYNHPCTIWVRESIANWLWLAKLSGILEDEWRLRYNHSSSHRHKSAEFIERLEIPKWLPDIPMTPFAMAMPEKYEQADRIAAYRTYYIHDKIYNKAGKLMCVWRNRGVPDWYQTGANQIPTHPLCITK